MKLIFKDSDAAVSFLPLAVRYRAVGNPFYNVILERILPDGSCNRQLYFIPTQIFLVTGLFHPPLLANVVVMELAGATCARDADHRTFALAAKELPC